MDKKLTNAEIVKALECCLKREKGSCNDAECPLFYKTVTYTECRKMLLKATLDLINRLQTERKQLTFNLELKQEEIEDLRDYMKTKFDASLSLVNEYDKTVAVKEFADEIRAEIRQALQSNYDARAKRLNRPVIGEADEFVSYCDGKIAALRGIDELIERKCRWTKCTNPQSN